MTDDAGNTAGRPRASGGTWGKKLARLLGIVLVGAVAVLAILLLFPPTGILKDAIAEAVMNATGRTLKIERAELSFWPDPIIRLYNVALSNPPDMEGPDFLVAETATAKLRLVALWKRRIEILSLDLAGAALNLQEDADGQNWTFDTAGPAPGAAPAAGGAAPASPLPLPHAAKVENGRVTFLNSKTGASAEVRDVNGTMTNDPATGASKTSGTASFKGQTVTYDVALADIGAAVAGLRTDIDASLGSPLGKARLNGQAMLTGTASFAGGLVADTPSAFDLARWMGSDMAPSESPVRTSLDGKIKAVASIVDFTATEVVVNGTTSQLDGRLSFTGPRPKLEGSIASDRIDLDRLTGRNTGAGRLQAAAVAEDPIEVTPGWDALLADLEALEAGPAARAAPEASAAATASSAWSSQPFNLKGLSAVDLDVVVTAGEIGYGGLDLKRGRVKAGLVDGVLDANLEALDVGDGKATGKLNLDSRANPPRTAMAINLTDVAAEPIINELAGKPLLSGTSNVDITANAAGQNQSQLASTLQGKAVFHMGKGAIRGFDIRRMISEWWRSWKFDLAMKTGFERLDAHYDIRNGVARTAPDTRIGGSEVEINSSGNVNLPAKKLDQEIRIKVVPPPTALPIPVKITGDWAKPTIGVDWGGLFSGLFGLGPPQAVATAAEPPPPEVQAAIRRVLAADIDPSLLSAEGRAMLQGLLPAGDGTPAAP